MNSISASNDRKVAPMPGIATIGDIAHQMEHITSLLAAAQQVLAGHPAHDLVEIIRTHAEVLANDIDVLAEAAEA